MATSQTMAHKQASAMQSAGVGLAGQPNSPLIENPAVGPARSESAEWSLLNQFTIANAVTTASLVAGLSALLIATRTGLAMPGATLRLAVGLICLAGFLDAVDGPIARHTHTSGPFGCNLDSLADVVSFGVTPAVVL